MAELKDKELEQVNGGFEFNIPDSEKEYEHHFYDSKPVTPEEFVNVTTEEIKNITNFRTP